MLFNFEILYRRKGEDLIIRTQEVSASDSFTAEELFGKYFSDCNVLDVRRK